MSRRHLIVVGLTMAVALVAGCDSGDDVDSQPSTTTSSAEAEDAKSFQVFLQPEELGNDCSEVVAAERTAAAGGDVEEALRSLLGGVNDEERARGLTSWFSSETAGMLNSVEIVDGVAEVDFEDFSAIIPNASSSCGSEGLLAQLDNTVLQFPEIDRAVYSFNGDRDAFYNWLQRAAPED